MKMKLTVKKIVYASMLTALCCIATMIIKIPSPLKGYLNLGDCVVLLSGFMLPPSYGFIAAGAGSAMADIFSGYVVYAPATFIIKGVMALISNYGFKLLGKKLAPISARIISAVIAESIMVLGYYVFEGFIYGFLPSVANIPANMIQGIVGLALGVLLASFMEKQKNIL